MKAVARVWALLLCAALGCAVPSPAQNDAKTEGHQRMLDLLAEVSRQSKLDNPFLGRGDMDARLEELTAIPPGTIDPRRWVLNVQLGRDELRLGNNEKAIEYYLESYEMLDAFEGLPAEQALTMIFELGVAYMRLGETVNCAQRHTADSCLLPIQAGGVHVEKEPALTAIRYLEQVLQQAPPGTPLYWRARWIVNIAYMTVGRYPDGVPDAWRIRPEVFESDEPFPRFYEIAPSLGLNVFDLAGGAIAEDFDGDGLLDLMVSSSDTDGQMHYFRNAGDGTFEERTKEAGLPGFLGGLNMIQADYDNDGDVDVLVLRGGWWESYGRHPNSLLQNRGDGTFRDVTFDAGLGAEHYPTQTAAWADYDNDGDLDLYLGNETTPEFAGPCQLFRNDGDGTFTDVTARAGVANGGQTKGVGFGDYNGDRFPDLYVSNLGLKNKLYHNNGDGTFTDVADKAGVTRPVTGFATWFWDFDNDGTLDLFVASYGGVQQSPDVAAVAASYLRRPHNAELDRLYRGDGKGGFKDVAVEQGLTKVTVPMGSNFGDLDNDGFLDFYLGTGYPLYEALVPNVMYRNKGGTGFADVTTSGGFGHLQKGHGVVFADLDHDGDQDVFEQVGGQYPGDEFGNALFENPGFEANWIKLKLVGTRSNHFGVGARIRLEIDDGGRRRQIFRHVNSGGSFGGSPFRREIGLGSARKIDVLEVDWPTSGTTQTFTDVAAGQLIEITEGQDTFRKLPLRAVPFKR